VQTLQSALHTALPISMSSVYLISGKKGTERLLKTKNVNDGPRSRFEFFTPTYSTLEP